MQFGGSIVVCATNGNSYSASIFFAAPSNAFAGSPIFRNSLPEPFTISAHAARCFSLDSSAPRRGPNRSTGLSPGDRLPCGIGHHCDAAPQIMLVPAIRRPLFAKERRHLDRLNLNDLLYARHSLRFFRVEFLNAPPEYGRPRNHRVQHPWNFRVDAVMRFANHDRPAINARLGGTEDAVILRVFQRHIFRDGQSRSFRDKLAIREPAAPFLMLELCCFPMRCTLPQGRSTFPLRALISICRAVAPAFRSGSHELRTLSLPARRHVAIFQFGSRDSLLNFDFRPVCVQFLRKYHRHRRSNALAHFRSRRDQPNFAVRMNFDERIRREVFGRIGNSASLRGISPVKANHQARASRRASLQEIAS